MILPLFTRESQVALKILVWRALAVNSRNRPKLTFGLKKANRGYRQDRLDWSSPSWTSSGQQWILQSPHDQPILADNTFHQKHSIKANTIPRECLIQNHPPYRSPVSHDSLDPLKNTCPRKSQFTIEFTLNFENPGWFQVTSEHQWRK